MTTTDDRSDSADLTPKKGLSRRAFLGGLGATAAVAATAGIAACSPAPSTDDTPVGGGTGNTTDSAGLKEPAFLTLPAVPATISETKDCDVLVIGLGLAGICAAREAAEAGKKVIGVEKQEQLAWVSMAGDFGVVGSQIQKDLGIVWADKADIVNQLQKDMTYRTNPVFFDYWYENSGADFDWFVQGAEFEVLPTSAANKSTDLPNYIRPKCFPPLEGYDWKTEYYPYFHGTITTNPNMDWACNNTLSLAEAAGAEFLYGMWGEQLIKDDSGTITGAYIHDKDKVYTQINAKRVILTTGDYGNNMQMRDYYIPWANEFTCYYTQMDPDGVPCDTGDGQLMGIWAGGEMELGPHAPMTHHMGGPLGVDAFLQLNLQGRRFMNEDIPGQNIADQLSRQPGKESWQIFDSKWPEQLLSQPTGHGYVNYYIPADQADQYKTVLEGFGLGYITSAMMDESVASGATLQANSIEELAGLMDLDPTVVKEEIDRYNQMCAAGYDDDFGKDPRRLYPVAEPPFYASKFGSAGMLVLMGGLKVDNDLHVLDANDMPIPGLFTAGNTQGGRYLVEYPVTVAGISLGTALCFGRLAGKNAVADL